MDVVSLGGTQSRHPDIIQEAPASVFAHGGVPTDLFQRQDLLAVYSAGINRRRCVDFASGVVCSFASHSSCFPHWHVELSSH